MNESDFYAHGLQANYTDNDNTLYSLECKVGEDSSNISFFDSDFGEVSFSMGKHYPLKFGATILQAGIGYRAYEDKRVDQSKITIPLSASFTVGKFVGMSWSANVNLSEDDPTLGLGIKFLYGKFN